ncbi:SDR family NAD(P)-dependent oxidoreductase [Rhodococcus rhodochrous]|uniref:SDR family NAD(P)-dependent oxidoreductase n=1 Tax=Rhodococcus rhodochrous TaxID=1829 RepID=UPI0009C06560|nr:SDR family oxidoreductase [Rhodococcus rhodochrous]
MTDHFRLDGVRAIVTGSSRGLGMGIARALLGQGAAVVINGVDQEETHRTLERLVSEFPAGKSRRLSAVAGDISDPDVAEMLVSGALKDFGGVDHLVCNAGIDVIKPAIDYSVDEWSRVVDVNLRGAFLPAQVVARHWISLGKPGSITMTSSIAGSVGVSSLAPYAASKGGLNQLVRTLAAEWATHAIRVNAVAPGYIDNIMEGTTAHHDPDSQRRIETLTPLARRGQISEISLPYAFLASPAANYITGSILAVDGGYTAI